MSAFARLAAAGLTCAFIACAQEAAPVRVWEEKVIIPTYVTGPPDDNPFFYTGRTYQGARGEVYPYAMYDNLTNDKVDKEYRQVCLENEYVKVCVLPELGGRIFEAKDKTNGYDFFYKQSVIKPALIGMIGAWISGGVEWNIPHHHRASSLLPVRVKTEEQADGARTIWIGEMELRDRMRWAVGLTLRPRSSVLEAQVTALNTSPFANSLLYFANVAVHTNDDYQILFPPRTQWATQHAKREFIEWPIGRRIYNGIDYTKGVDLTMWKNHPSSVSMFAWNDSDDFLAGYDHGKQAGTMHVADRHQAPGKKFFAWGTGPSGRMWDNILSDTDGPYLELMVGAWSDNQPDYSWMMPYETKTVKQYWYPFRGIGGVKHATVEAAVNLDVKDGRIHAGFYVTSPKAGARAVLTAAGKEIWSETKDLDPAAPLVHTMPLPAGVNAMDVRVALLQSSRELAAYQPEKAPAEPMPPAVVPPGAPESIKTTEELLLAGQRLEQLHNPAREPEPYYEEALKRDAGDARANTALGLRLLKKARYADAERHLRAAVARVEHNHTRAKDGEALYYLGLALKFQGKLEEAETILQRAVWTYAWQSPAYFHLAEIAGRQGRLTDALALADRALVTNAWNTRALFLKGILLLREGRGGEASEVRRQLGAIDPLDPRGFRNARELVSIFTEFPDEGLETVASCLNGGLYREAELLLDQMPVQSPMVAYYRGWLALKNGQEATAKAHFERASKMPLTRVFPFQFESIEVLREAMKLRPEDPRPPYSLGLFLFDRQREEAMKLFERAAGLDPSLAIVHRNLAVGHALENRVPEAIAALEKAIRLNSGDALYFFEIDLLKEWAQRPVEERLGLFRKHPETVAKRDDAMARYAGLLVQAGQLDEAIGLMEKRHFHLWEGGVRFNAHDSWTDAHVERGRQRLAARDYKGALADFERAIDYPANLEATRAYRGSRAPETLYYAGLAYEALRQPENARRAWRESAAELLGTEDNPRPGVGSGAVLLYFQGRSLEKLNNPERARKIFQALVEAGDEALKRGSGEDFFAKFGDRQSPQMRRAEAYHVRGLGRLGLSDSDGAQRDFDEAVKLNVYLRRAAAGR